jgi:hypothetical protein
VNIPHTNFVTILAGALALVTTFAQPAQAAGASQTITFTVVETNGVELHAEDDGAWFELTGDVPATLTAALTTAAGERELPVEERDGGLFVSLDGIEAPATVTYLVSAD